MEPGGGGPGGPDRLDQGRRPAGRPGGIVATSTAASFSAPLVALHIGGADRLLPATFLVIVGTVAIYDLTATPLAGALGLREPEPDGEPRGTTP